MDRFSYYSLYSVIRGRLHSFPPLLKTACHGREAVCFIRIGLVGGVYDNKGVWGRPVIIFLYTVDALGKRSSRPFAIFVWDGTAN